MKDDLTGRKFGRLTVLRINGRGSWWVCKCKCGKQAIVQQHRLLNNDVRSCGCWQKEHRATTLAKASKKAGEANRQMGNERKGAAQERLLQAHNVTDIRQLLVDTLNATGSAASAAERLGITSKSMLAWMKEMKIEKVWK